jgi:hypothetical protein
MSYRNVGSRSKRAVLVRAEQRSEWSGIVV